ncbi:hypothetical protein KP509_05G088200 [Ceratopteris richardii]|nr:hypothetical protein KP509_05G088200 [Ceratopteris richardii]
MWCIAGLKLALQTVRGVELESRSQFTRLSVAQCYAESGEFSSQTSELIKCEDQDSVHLSSLLQQAMLKYREMNFVRKMVMSAHEKIKHDTIYYLSQRLKSSFHTAEVNNVAPCVEKLPQTMRIGSEELSFASPPCVIAQNSSVSVYEASWHGKKVAVKQFDYRKCKEYPIYEVGIHARLRCPFIVHLHGWSLDTNDYSYYLVFELMDCNLVTLMKERDESHKQLTLPVVIDLMLQLSRAMEYLHSKGIMHKDIRPYNILVHKSSACAQLAEKGYGRVKLCNFGFDRWKLDTAQSCILGYRAPEVWALHEKNRVEHLDYTFEADVYGFGMTFAFCLIGKDPFVSDIPRASLRQFIQRGITLDLPPSCPQVLVDLLHSCLSKSLSARPSFSSITMALQHLKLLMMKSRDPDGIGDPLMVDREFFSSMPVISYKELCNATTDFSSKAHNISMHSMYHGVLSDGTKVLTEQMQGVINMRKLWRQTSQLMSLRHSNVAGLRAVCIDSSRYWFIIENSSVCGSLDKWLENHHNQVQLDVTTCYRIAVGTACGLQYLHAQRIVYAVTAENILLDDRYEPQLLAWSVQCEGIEEDLEYLQRLDVVHFGTLITKLLSYLSMNNSNTQSPMENRQACLLKRVEDLCSNAQMDEVVELLESIYDSCHEEASDYQEDVGVNVEESTTVLSTCSESCISMFDSTRNLVVCTDNLREEPLDQPGPSHFISI